MTNEYYNRDLLQLGGCDADKQNKFIVQPYLNKIGTTPVPWYWRDYILCYFP